MSEQENEAVGKEKTKRFLSSLDNATVFISEGLKTINW